MLSNTNMSYTDTQLSQYESQCFTVNIPGKNKVRDVTKDLLNLVHKGDEGSKIKFYLLRVPGRELNQVFM